MEPHEILFSSFIVTCFIAGVFVLLTFFYAILLIIYYLIVSYVKEYYKWGDPLPYGLSINRPDIKEIRIFEDGKEIKCDKDELDFAYTQLYKTTDYFDCRSRGNRIVNLCMFNGENIALELSRDGKMISKSGVSGIYKNWYYVPKGELLFNKIKSK